MGFTIECNKCGNKHVIEDKNSFDFDGINVDVTEECNVLGCTVESIDIRCWNCDHEVNL